MLAIRMQRNGRTHTPVYRIVVQEAQRHPLSGRVVAEVGNYNPETKKTVLDQEKIGFYLAHGAQPSSRVAFILKQNGIKLPAWYQERPATLRLSTPTSSARTSPRKRPPRTPPTRKLRKPRKPRPAHAEDIPPVSPIYLFIQLVL